jgi:hypothetical protein
MLAYPFHRSFNVDHCLVANNNILHPILPMPLHPAFEHPGSYSKIGTELIGVQIFKVSHLSSI